MKIKKLGELTLYGEYTVDKTPRIDGHVAEWVNINHPVKYSVQVYADLEVYTANSRYEFPDWPTLRAWVEAQMALGILGDTDETP